MRDFVEGIVFSAVLIISGILVFTAKEDDWDRRAGKVIGSLECVLWWKKKASVIIIMMGILFFLQSLVDILRS
jgi:hypothetical protein